MFDLWRERKEEEERNENVGVFNFNFFYCMDGHRSCSVRTQDVLSSIYGSTKHVTCLHLLASCISLMFHFALFCYVFMI